MKSLLNGVGHGEDERELNKIQVNYLVGRCRRERLVSASERETSREREMVRETAHGS